ncbi:hypothetical protein C0J52_24797 [Blattella germanica]|nr:hypothetical protein C0J52_24797 [Blattella germanica]
MHYFSSINRTKLEDVRGMVSLHLLIQDWDLDDSRCSESRITFSALLFYLIYSSRARTRSYATNMRDVRSGWQAVERNGGCLGCSRTILTLGIKGVLLTSLKLLYRMAWKVFAQQNL